MVIIINNEEILQYAIKNGILDMQCIQQQIKMNRINEILQKHPYGIIYNEKKERWFTRFKTDEGIIQRNRKTKEELIDLIVDFYMNNGNITGENKTPHYISFKNAHDRWLEAQEEYERSPNTIYKYTRDWNRFFDGTDFAKKDVTLITVKDIEIFMINRIKEFNLKRQGAITLYGYINGVFYNLVMDRIIEHQNNPCLYVDKKKFNKYYNKEVRPISERTYSPQNVIDLLNTINQDLHENELFLSPYGVKLALLTGMRSGEICGLKWSHIHDDHIHICEAENYNCLTNKYEQHSTKNGKTRDIPLTDNLREYLSMLKDFQSIHGCYNDFVISYSGKKLRTRQLSDYMVKRSKRLGFECSKNIHAIRRTFNSLMREDGASALTAGSIIGNTVEVNNNHYTFDIKNLEEKRKYITSAENQILCGRKIV